MIFLKTGKTVNIYKGGMYNFVHKTLPISSRMSIKQIQLLKSFAYYLTTLYNLNIQNCVEVDFLYKHKMLNNQQVTINSFSWMPTYICA